MLFWADLYGYLIWGEFGDWGISGHGPMGDNQQPTASFIGQWVEAVERDLSHPQHHRLVPAERDPSGPA